MLLKVSCFNLAFWTPVKRPKLVLLDRKKLSSNRKKWADDYGQDLPPQKSAQCTSIITGSDCSLIQGLNALSEKSFSLTKAWLDLLDVGSEVDCLDFQGKWFVATIVSVDEEKNLLKVHFQGWPSTYDEWVHRYSGRITKIWEKTGQIKSREASRILSNEISELRTLYVEGLSAEERMLAKVYTGKTQKKWFQKRLELKRKKELEYKKKIKWRRSKSEPKVVLVSDQEKDGPSRNLVANTREIKIQSRRAKKFIESESHTKWRSHNSPNLERQIIKYRKFLDDIRRGKIKAVDALNFQGYWWTAKVTILLVNSDEVNISFDGWLATFDEFIPIASGKLAPLKSRAKGGREYRGVKGTPMYSDRLDTFKIKDRV